MIRALVIAMLACAALPVLAQTAPPRFMPDAPEPLVRQLQQLALDNLHRARDPEGNPLPADAEGTRPPTLSLAEARRVIDVGLASAAARWCALDWLRSQQGLVAEQRARQRWSEREIAYIAVLHDVTMASLYNEVRQRPCPAEERTRVSEFLARRWRN